MPQEKLPNVYTRHCHSHVLVGVRSSDRALSPSEVSKPRIDCIDGCRFALVFPIVIAHFARCTGHRCDTLAQIVCSFLNLADTKETQYSNVFKRSPELFALLAALASGLAPAI